VTDLLPTPLYRSVDEALAAVPSILRGVVPQEPSDLRVLLRHRDTLLHLMLVSCRAPRDRGRRPVVWRGGLVLREFPQGFSWFGAAVGPGDDLLVEHSKYCRMLSQASHDYRWWMAFGRCHRQVRAVEATFADGSTMAGQLRQGRFLIGGELKGLRELHLYSAVGRVLETIPVHGPLRDVVPLFDGPAQGPFTVQASAEMKVSVEGRVEPTE
jgi:hypothetical protein